MRKWIRLIAIGSTLLVLATTLWFALTPQVEVMFARNVLSYRLEQLLRIQHTQSDARGVLYGWVGEVRSEFIVPVGNATILASDPDGRTFTARSNGLDYEISVPEGVYVPMAVSSGYEDTLSRNFLGLKSSVTVQANQRYRVDFLMRRVQPRAQTADESLKFFDEALVRTDVPAPPDGLWPGTPWGDDFGKGWEMSPLKYVENVKTPLLIIHSEGDLRCPISQSEEWFTALKWLGQNPVFVRYPPETSHGLSRGGPIDLRYDRLTRIGDWLDQHLTAKTLSARRKTRNASRTSRLRGKLSQ